MNGLMLGDRPAALAGYLPVGLELDPRLLAAADEVGIALLVFAFIVTSGLAALAIVRSVKGWARPEVESRLRALETATSHGDGLASVIRGVDVADLKGLSLGSSWLQDLSFTNRMQRRLGQAGLEMSPGEFLGCVLLAAFLGGAAAYVAGWHDWRLAVPALLAAVFPFWWLAWRRNQRLKLFGAQLPDALELMAGSLRAGHAYSSAVQVVGEELPEPLAAEFRTMAEEYRVGIGHRECLDRLLGRIDHPDLRLFAISVLIQAETGGNLAQVLEGLAGTIRARFNIEGKVRALTAEGRMSGVVLAALPLAVGMILFILNPTYLDPLLRTSIGIWAIALALFLQLLGFLWIRKIVRVRA